MQDGVCSLLLGMGVQSPPENFEDKLPPLENFEDKKKKLTNFRMLHGNSMTNFYSYFSQILTSNYSTMNII